VQLVTCRRIYGGYDNIIARLGALGRVIRNALQWVEGTPLDSFGLSHFLVLERLSGLVNQDRQMPKRNNI
jgi:hypothetical protein